VEAGQRETVEVLWSAVMAPKASDVEGAIREVAGRRRIAVISDANVMPLYGAPFAKRFGVSEDDCFTIAAGESSKTRGEWSRITDAMLARGFGRDSLVVAIGGGVVGDLGGFVAATYMRGVPVIQVPTTLLAMIDASIGGKTGVDTPAGKNLVGAFHEPLLVLADLRALKTLPPAEFRAGLAEAVKHALITSKTELDWLLTNAAALAALDLPTLRDLVRRHVEIKLKVVFEDEREAGVRKTLNFGHTIGHAVEAMSNYSMLHGECVAIGMVVEARIAAAMKLAPATLVDRVQAAVETFGLPSRIPGQMAPGDILAATRSDKKSRGGQVEYALLADIGRVANAQAGYGTSVPDSVAIEALKASR
jgi:3-dehydroquinate synthase